MVDFFRFLEVAFTVVRVGAEIGLVVHAANRNNSRAAIRAKKPAAPAQNVPKKPLPIRFNLENGADFD